MPKKNIGRKIALRREEEASSSEQKKTRQRYEQEYYPVQPEVSLRSYKKTAIGFLSLAIALLLAIVYVSFSSATITVIPRETEGGVEITAEVRQDPTDGEIAGEIKTIVLEGERIQAISGETHEVPAKATGTVKLINDWSKSQQLVATTRLLSKEGILFRLKNGLTIPAKNSLMAEVYADKPGKEGNLPPTSFTIPGLNKDLQKQIYATSDTSMGGGVLMKIGVGQGDVERASEEIAKQIMENGTAEIKKMWELGLGNAEIYEKKFLLVESNPPPGSDAKSFKVKAKVRVSGIRYDRENLYALAEEKLKQKAGADEELVSADMENFSVEVVKIDPETNIATLKAKLNGKFSITEKSSILDPDQLVGLTKISVQNYLRGFHSVEDVKVKISPFWLKRLPNLRDRINIKVITK